MVMTGRLIFHSETGTEGGFWAFQDQKFMTPNDTSFVCDKCHSYWDKKRHPDSPAHLYDERKKCEHEWRVSPPEWWDYAGLHILETGDRLIVYNDDDSTYWEGMVDLEEYPVFFKEWRGWWIHSTAKNVPLDMWAEMFFKQRRATLTLRSEP